MGAAVQDVHHRHGQRVVAGAVERADVRVERQPLRERLGPQRGHGDAEQGVGAEAGFGRRAVERDHRVIERALVERLADERAGEFAVDVRNRVADTLAKVARLVAVSQFERFALTGGGAGGNGGASHCAPFEGDIHFHGRVAA